MTLNTVLEGSDAAKDFLIAFITKRFNLEKGLNAPRTRWERYWEKGAVLAEAAKRPVRNSISSRPLSSDDTSDSCSSSPVHVVTRPPAVETNREPSILLTDQQIISAVHQWFVDNVDPNFHLEICEEARRQVRCYPLPNKRSMISKSLGDLIEEARPTIDSGQSCDYTNGHIDWLLLWMVAVRSDPKFIFQAIGCGYDLAK